MTDKAMLDILSTFSQATDKSKPLTEGKRTVTADTAMADILGKLQQLNEGAEGKMPSKKHVMDMCKDGKSEKEMLEMHADADKDKLKDLIKTCKEEMKDSKEEMDEAHCNTKKKRTNESAIAEGVARIEAKLLKEFTKFKEKQVEDKSEIKNMPYIPGKDKSEIKNLPHTPGKPKTDPFAIYREQIASLREQIASLREEPNEGNEFSGALAKAKAEGKTEFEVDGKKYKVTAEAKKPYVKPFDASGVRVGKRGKVDTVHRDYYHVKMEKDNVTKAERVLADDGESEMHIRMNAKRDNPGWKIVSVRKIDNTDDKQEKYSAQDRGRPKKIEVDEATKPDYLDLDGDGDKKEPMKKAAKDKKAKEKK